MKTKILLCGIPLIIVLLNHYFVLVNPVFIYIFAILFVLTGFLFVTRIFGDRVEQETFFWDNLGLMSFLFILAVVVVVIELFVPYNIPITFEYPFKSFFGDTAKNLFSGAYFLISVFIGAGYGFMLYEMARKRRQNPHV